MQIVKNFIKNLKFMMKINLSKEIEALKTPTILMKDYLTITKKD